jgi:hypothetical protein
MKMNIFTALKAFPHGNSYVSKGASVELSDRQATFLLEGGFVTPAEGFAAPAATEPVQEAPAMLNKEEEFVTAPKPASEKKGGKK